MKKFTIIIVLGFLCPFFKANAQRFYTTKPLKIGDTVPDVTVNNIINYKSNSIQLRDYKDKLLILDFWGITCAPCVQHLPIMYALQKEFGNKIFILPVNIGIKPWDSREKVTTFLQKRKKAYNLPTVVLDTLLRNTFQIQSMGTYVWIKNGVINQITDGDEVTSGNIQKVLNGNNPSLRQYVPVSKDWNKPISFEGNGNSPLRNFYSKSYFGPFAYGLGGGGNEKDSLGKIIRIYAYNSPLLALLYLAYPAYNHFQGRIKIQSRYADLLNDDFSTDSLRRIKSFVYDGNFPPSSPAQAAEYVKEDIKRVFPIVLDSTSVTDTCWILRLSKVKKLRANGLEEPETNVYDHTGLPIYFKNKPIDVLRSSMEKILKTPVLNETGYERNISLDLPSDFKDTSQLSRSLAKQGIILTRELRSVEYLVIKDQPDSN